MLKKIILLVALIYSSYANEFNMSLKTFTELVAVQNKINVLINPVIESEKFIFIVANKRKTINIKQYENMLKANNLKLIFYKDFYFVDNVAKTLLDTQKELKQSNYFVDYENLRKDDLDKIFKYYDLKYMDMKSRLMFTTDHETYKHIKLTLSKYDRKDKYKYVTDCSYFKTSSYNKKDGGKHIVINFIDNCLKDKEDVQKVKKTLDSAVLVKKDNKVNKDDKSKILNNVVDSNLSTKI